MALLLDQDYEELASMGVGFVEDDPQRFFVFKNYLLPDGLYNATHCEVLIVIPSNYNHAGNDMFWTYPHLLRSDQIVIPCVNLPGGGDNRHFDGKEFCRWSRHWNSGNSVWRPGTDNIRTIQRRIAWALRNPDAK